MSPLTLSHTSSIGTHTLELPASKSESNRALIINELAGNTGKLSNISAARDTQTMQRLLKANGEVWDVIDAGTTMRFLTALASVSVHHKLMTGTGRMCARPISILVDALREIGADISYEKEDGYPPLNIKPFKGQKASSIKVKSDISSQYISALLMIAPTLPQGLTIELIGKFASRPYVAMTTELMQRFGVDVGFDGRIFTVKPQQYLEANYTIESDWSGSSYWYSMVCLSKNGEIHLTGFRKDSFQGDNAIVEIMQKLGVETKFEGTGITLTKSPDVSSASIDFSDCPDLAQTLVFMCAANQTKLVLSGIDSLRIKETDRISALQTEIAKIGATMIETNEGQWEMTPAERHISEYGTIEFDTYHDHRMAMAAAPLATLTSVRINDPEVVNKSYPSFWDDVKKVGIKIN